MKRFLKNKRGDGDTYVVMTKWVYYFVAITIISFAIISFAGRGIAFVQSQASTPLHLDEDILLAQLVNVCFVYEEASGNFAGKTTQNILDLNKINQLRLDDCTYDSLELTLQSIDDSFETIQLSTGRTRGEFQTTRYVLVQTSTGLVPAFLTVIL